MPVAIGQPCLVASCHLTLVAHSGHVTHTEVVEVQQLVPNVIKTVAFLDHQPLSTVTLLNGSPR